MYNNCIYNYTRERKIMQEQEEKNGLISNKENAIEQAGLEYDGGTMRPMVENQTGADLTKQRVYELSQYLK